MKDRDGVVMLGLMSNSDPFGTRARQDAQHQRNMAQIDIDHQKGLAADREMEANGLAIALGVVRAQGREDYCQRLWSDLCLSGVQDVFVAVNRGFMEAAADDTAAKKHSKFLLSHDRPGSVTFANQERRAIFASAVRKKAKEMDAAAVEVQRGYVKSVTKFAEEWLVSINCIGEEGGSAI